MLIIAICQGQVTVTFGRPPCESLQNAKKRTYGFHPRQLEKAQRAEKSSQMDDFWKLAKQLQPTSVKCLADMLSEEKDDGFFLFDGAALLYSLDQSETSTAAVRDAALRSDLNELDAAGYIRLVLNLSSHGVDVGPLAIKYLTFPKVEAYLPFHSMKLDRLEGGTILFGSMPPSQADKYLPQALSADKPEVRNTAAMLLAFAMTEDSFKALKSPSVLQSLSADTRKQLLDFTRYSPPKPVAAPKFSREQVLKILRRMPHTKEEYDALLPEYTKYNDEQFAQHPNIKPGSKELADLIRQHIEEGEPFFGISGAKRFAESAIQTLREDDLDELREARRKSIQGVSDEALYEYFAYTQILLGVINRLDLYREFRSH